MGNPRVPEPIALAEGPAEEFEVAQLLAKRQIRGQQVQFLVRWKGYGPHKDTWNLSENLENAARLVKEFEEKLGTGEKTKRRRKKTK